MPRPSKTFLITDTHWYDDNMFEFGRPPNYNQLIISNLKYYVAKQDILIHLGDVIDDKMKSALHIILDSINCKVKLLIRGNHDRQSLNWYVNNGFHFVMDSLTLGEVILSHKPLMAPVQRSKCARPFA